MIGTIAWRNIWRNKVRSIVVIMAIAVGLLAGVFASAFVSGLMSGKVDKVIRLEMAHFQVHHPEFRDEPLPRFTLTDGPEVVHALERDPVVQGVSGRTIALPMMSSPKYSSSLRVTGMDPEKERTVTDLHAHVVEGAYFEGMKRNPILVSRKTAEKYDIRVRSKVVLTLQDVHGVLTAGAFRVVGIYETENAMYDEMNAFVRHTDLYPLLGTGPDDLHEVAVLLTDHEAAQPMADLYQERWPELEVLSWMGLSTTMRFMVEMQDTYTLIIVGILLVALLFSIINTMLMAVLERTREIGMLMAVGMTKPQVFRMILLETVFLTLIGGPLGLLLAWGCTVYFGTYGIDLGGSAYGDMGFSNVVYPQLDTLSYLRVSGMVLIMAILAAIYPARKALKLIPVEAIRKS